MTEGPDLPASTAAVREVLIAEDLLLLLTDDTSGRLQTPGDQVDTALGGALLVELTLLGRVGPSGDDDPSGPGLVVVRDPTAVPDPLLDEALRQLTGVQGRRPASVVPPLGSGLLDRLYGRLVQRGILRAEKRRVLGVFPTRSWPTEVVEHERALRRRIGTALARGRAEDERTAALISLLHALQAVPVVLDADAPGVDRQQAERNAQAIAEGDWGSAAVRQAIDETMAAVMVTSTAVTTVTGT